MSNHYHLLLSTMEGNLSQIMQHINVERVDAEDLLIDILINNASPRWLLSEKRL